MARTVEMRTMGDPLPYSGEILQTKKRSYCGRCWTHIRDQDASLGYCGVLALWCMAVVTTSFSTYMVVDMTQNPDNPKVDKEMTKFLIVFLYMVSLTYCCTGCGIAVMTYRKTAERLRTTPEAPLLENA